MKISVSSALSALSLTCLVNANVASRQSSNDTCITPRPIPEYTGADLKNFGVVVFDALDMIDIFGPLDPLQILAKRNAQLNLHLIAETLDVITTAPSMPAMNPYNSSFWPLIPVTNTFEDELDLDVLIVPGGPGVRAPNMQPVEDYLKKIFPKVKIFMTVCTGAALAGRAGLLDGYLATTNKAAWASTEQWGPNVDWVSPARYIIDGKVWSSSGVVSSLDLAFAFIAQFWGEKIADDIATVIEHVPREWYDDPISGKIGIPPTPAQPCRA